MDAFPNYTQLKTRLPVSIWWALRLASLLLTLTAIFLLFTQPDTGLVLFWKLLIPLLPLSFAVIPGLWRNICPMALLNQLPRTLGFGRQNTLSARMRKLALYVSSLSFVGFVLLRQPLINQQGFTLGIILSAGLVLALLGGYYFKGRSGWCGTFCPLAPLQKAYGHAPLLMVKNGYCESCVGCQKNCYDFNPRATIFSDLNDTDQWWSEQRLFFIALLPGLISGFFNSSFSSTSALSEYLLSMLTPMAISTGVFYLLHALLNLNYFRLASLYSMLALGLFYWHGTPLLASALVQLFNIQLNDSLITGIQYAVVLVCVLVVLRGLVSERAFKLSRINATRATLGDGMTALKAALSQTSQMVQVNEQSSGQQIMVRKGQSLLDAIEDAELPIMSGCRMGMCGSDPIVVTEGLDNLNPADENELNTLRRLGLEGKARLACCCKPAAGISIDLAADPATNELQASTLEPVQNQDDERFTIVIIGNGIAGISTAENVRKKDTDCRVILITMEPYHFYNRMGLEQALHGKSAIQDLYLLKNEWYQRNHIDFWLNTRVNAIEAAQHRIVLGTGETLHYDRLVLATGANAFVPDQACYRLPGVFSLRSASDALEIRSWAQVNESRRAVVLGGGVLGIEAADALLQLGLKVSIIHSADYLMNRQLDQPAAKILSTFLNNRGIRVLTSNGISNIDISGELKRVYLQDGKVLVSDIILLCIGVRANTSLAQSAGLRINRGVVVDEQMRTSDPDIFCVGDAAELPGAMSGLWSVGSEQGRIAAEVLSGGTARYSADAIPAVQLKVNGIDLKCFGSVEAGAERKSYSAGSVESNCWRHIVTENGRICGGVFVNAPLSANATINAAKKQDATFSAQEIHSMLNKDAN